MKNKEKVKKLKQFMNIKKELEEISLLKEKIRCAMIDIKSPTLTDMPKSQGRNNRDKCLDYLIKLDELEDKQDNLLRAFVEIECIIQNLENSYQRRLIRLRYIDCLSFEEIAVRMNYSWRTIHRMHSNALNSITLEGLD